MLFTGTPAGKVVDAGLAAPLKPVQLPSGDSMLVAFSLSSQVFAEAALVFLVFTLLRAVTEPKSSLACR